MLKKILAVILTITTLLSLGACSLGESNTTESTETETEVVTTVSSDIGIDSIDSVSNETTVESVDTVGTDTTELDLSKESQEFIQPSGSYNGSTITMTLTLTEYNYPSCQIRPTCFVNGYATICYHGKSEEQNIHQACTLIDKTGKMVVQPVYEVIGAVSADGKAVAYLADEYKRGTLSGDAKPYIIDVKNNTITEVNESTTEKYKTESDYIASKTDRNFHIEESDGAYTVIDKDGKAYHIFKDVFSAEIVSRETILCRWSADRTRKCALFDANGNRLSPEVEHIGIFENGLAAYIDNGKLGLVSDKGQIIIPAEIAVDDNFVAAYPPTLWFNEGLMFVNVDGTLGIVEVVRQK